MIPDHDTASNVIDANGWIRLHKPFTIDDIEDVITRAVKASVNPSSTTPRQAASEQSSVPRARRDLRT